MQIKYNLYRCHIDECDNKSPKYDTDWTEYAIPQKKGQLEACTRYTSNDIYYNLSLINNSYENRNKCMSIMFNSSNIIPCPTDNWVFRDQMSTISLDVNNF